MGLFDRMGGRGRAAGRGEPAGANRTSPAVEAGVEEPVVRDAIESLARLGFPLLRPVTASDIGLGYAEPDADLRRLLLDATDDEFRPYFGRVLPYDAEMVGDDGSYPRLVHELATATGATERLGEVRSELDFEDDTGWLSYVLDGQARRYDIEVDGDWADPDVVESVMLDFHVPDCYRMLAGFGQGGTFYWVAGEDVDEFRTIVPEATRDA